MRLPLLFLHIAGGVIGLLSGTVAMIFRKGSRGHRLAGDVFVVSMLVMGVCASILALMKHQPNNFFGGLVTIYMVATAWLTGKRRQEKTSLLDWGALVFVLVLSGVLLTNAVLVATGQTAKQPGVPVGMYFFLATITLLAAAGDVRMLARRGLSGAPRLARHLWRMCFGLFIASGSFFLGQQQVFPAVLRKQYLLFPLAILPLVLLIYWLVRVRFTNAIKRTATPYRTSEDGLHQQASPG
ncbi:MAG TPA: hypothetical protein VJP02_04435 [Candidatus Sulfotelmatobacter sp.]|nr:hypothetical protein [Candidatus Sulfotelmatobacter sp.]